MLHRSWSSFIRSLRRHPAYIILTLIILYLLGLAFSGFVGNSVYNGTIPSWLATLLRAFANFITTNLPIFTILISIVACWEIISNMQLRKTLNTTRSMAELDDSLLRLLSKLIDGNEAKSEQDIKNGIHFLLNEFLRDATRTILGDKDRGRAAIFCQMDQTGNYLEMIAYHRIPSDSIAHAKFYIGDDPNLERERGTVGESFQKLRHHIGHIEQKEDFWKSEDDNFKYFDENFEIPPYRSYVHVPITIKSSRSDVTLCLGILYFDCQSQTAFDNRDVLIILEALSRRIAAVFLIIVELLQSRKQPVIS